VKNNRQTVMINYQIFNKRPLVMCVTSAHIFNAALPPALAAGYWCPVTE
jgi:hypothetical protein